MAEESGEKNVAGSGGKSKLTGLLIGAVLVIVGAAGVVVMTAPGKREPEMKIDLDALEPEVYAPTFEWTFNPRGGTQICKLKIGFEYKAVLRTDAERMIALYEKRAIGRVRDLLQTKTIQELKESTLEVKIQIQDTLNEAFFSKIDAKISETYILEMLFQ
ncbi:MAG: hypothetical protein ACE5F1_05865 [Planctomycetota bacterium]